MDFDLRQHTMFLAVSGSWAYGTSLPASDVDVRGFGLPPRAYRSGFMRTFEQCDGAGEMDAFRDLVPERMQAGLAEQPLDGCVYELRKFFNLAAGANPNVLDTLFAHDDDVLVHLVRLLQSCREILETGDYSVRRPNAPELLAIRNGSWTYERAMAFASEQETALLEVAEGSRLPHSPDMKRLDALCSEIVEARDSRLTR